MGKKGKPVVLFTMVEAGLGHIVPMTAVYNAFLKKYGKECEVVCSRVFSDGAYPRLKKTGEIIAAHTERVAFNYLYNRFEAISYALPGGLVRKALDIRFGKAKDEFGKAIENIDPDLIVSNYYLPSRFAARLKKEGKTDARIATFSPDTYIYPAWDRNCDLFMVWNDRAEKDALKKGFPPEKIKKTAFLFSDGLKRVDKDKLSCRKRLGLKDAYTVLFTSGAYGEKKFCVFIKEFLKSDLPVQVVAVCGKNEKLKKRVLSLAAKNRGNVSLTVVGFTDKMAEYMVAADVVIGKASVNTVMEAGYLNRPMIVNAAASRLEEHTLKFCVEEGVAVKSFSPEKTLKAVQNDFLSGAGFGEDYKNFDKYRAESGAEECADALFTLLNKGEK